VTFLIDKKGEIRQVQAGQPDIPRLLEELVQL
jgi:peroxiredoxin Q/BCP